MIEIDAMTAWSPTERAWYAPLASHEINVATRDLQRALRFYRRVFGLRPIGDHGGGAPAILRVSPAAELVLHEVPESLLLCGHFVRAWGFVVGDLDRVRQIVWELGVTLSRDSGMPDSIYRWANGRSLYVWGPDGHQIELVEVGHAARIDGLGQNRAPVHDRAVEPAHRQRTFAA